MSTIVLNKVLGGAQMTIDGGSLFEISGSAIATSNVADDTVTLTFDGRAHDLKATNTFVISGVTNTSTSAAIIAASINASILIRGKTNKVYRALLTQSGTAAPTAVVFQNDLYGAIVWTRNAAGVYYGTLTGAFLSGKVFCQATPQGSDSSAPVYLGIGRASDNFVALGTGVPGSPNSDGLLNNTAVEILVSI